jgi:hypothetical protein
MVEDEGNWLERWEEEEEWFQRFVLRSHDLP